jgi:uncharacterized protein with HEPN domain
VKGNQLYLKHILDAIEKVDTYIAVGHEVFIASSHWQDAVIRQLEIIGEATKGCRNSFARATQTCLGVELPVYEMC